RLWNVYVDSQTSLVGSHQLLSTNHVYETKFSPDGKEITVGSPGAITIWDTQTGR
ncbi:hypothetical protein HYDPIDRAFT_115805, partial [Hydnomerulius pinastri MD-312]